MFFGTGNPAYCNKPEPYAEAVVELNASNLAYIASWQLPASQAIPDGDFGTTPTLFNNMLGIVNKNGQYYALNRSNIGSGPVWQTTIASAGNAPEKDNGSIAVGAWDGTYLYVAGTSTTINGTSCKASLQALRPSTGAFVWRLCLTGGPVLGPVVGVPGLVIVGSGKQLVAVNSATGQVLYTYTQPSGDWFVDASVSNGVLFAGVMGAAGRTSGGMLYAFTPNGR